MTCGSSYLNSGALERLVNSESPPYGTSGLSESSACLFGSPFLPDALSSSTRQLFALLRQQINDLARLASPTGVGRHNPTVCLKTAVRNGYKDCCAFLCYLQEYVFRKFQTSEHCSCSCSVIPPATEVSILHQQLKVLVKHIGPLSLTPLSAVESPAGSIDYTDSYGVGTKSWVARVLFQLKLDIYWAVIEALFRMQLGGVRGKQLDISGTCDVTVAGQVAELVKELIFVAAKWKNSATKILINFPPKHIQDIWIRVIHLIQWNAKEYQTAPFWSVVSGILTNDVLSSSPGAHVVSDPIGFSWWLLTKLAPLFWYDIKGNNHHRPQATVDSNWVFVHDLLRLSFHKDKDSGLPNESKWREYLCCLCSLCDHWAPSVDVVSLLWDVFSKRLNDHFAVRGSAIQEHGVPSSFEALLEYTKRLISQDVSTTSRTLNSFHLFLHVTYQIMTAAGLSSWKQMKGRFYSKFHRKKLLELTETGLANFNSLFMVLASVGDILDVGKKMVDYTSMAIGGLTLDVPKCQTVLRGQFALLQLCAEKCQDMKAIVEAVSKEFGLWQRSWMGQVFESNRRASLWKVMSQYLDGVCVVVRKSQQLVYSEHTLLNIDLDALVVHCRENELSHLFNCLASIISSFVQVVCQMANKAEDNWGNIGHSRLQHRDFAGVMWQKVFPCLRSKAHEATLSATVARSVADLAFGFLRLASNDICLLGQQSITFQDIVRDFATNDASHFQTAVAFLKHALEDMAISSQISSHEHLQGQIIHTWLRCVLTSCHSPCGTIASVTHLNEMDDLTDLVIQLPEMKDIAKEMHAERSTEVSALNNVEQSLHCFVVAVGKLHCQLAETSAGEQLRLKVLSYLGDLPKYLDPILTNPNAPSNSVKLVYDFSGLLVKYCSRIIYRAGQSGCLLPRLLTRLLPCVGKKTISPAVAMCVWSDNNHFFLKGLGCLFPDGFAMRKFREIFQQYFAESLKKLLDGGSFSALEPFNELLTVPSSVSTLPTTLQDVRQLSVEVIREQFLSLPRSPREIMPVLQFVQQLFKISEIQQIARETECLLPSVLGCLLACEQCSRNNLPGGMQSLLTDLLEMMLRASQENREIVSIRSLVSLLTSFLSSNTKLSGALVFRPLCLVAQLDQELAVELHPKARQAVNEIELSRGTGTDISLRTAFEEFSALIQMSRGTHH